MTIVVIGSGMRIIHIIQTKLENIHSPLAEPCKV